ncbi:MAG: hypothetical protein HOO96_35745 [Polyangiaceae bacterium]|nr:hypothetical protein [Polyangiaceae bacterium]
MVAIAAHADPAPVVPAKDAPTTEPKEAQEAEHPKVSVGLLVGYASTSLNFGFGARGGYTFPMNLYVGGTLQYHLGTSVLDSRISLLYGGAEGGYDFHVGPVVIRPYGGIGPAFVLGGGETRAALGFWPGATAYYGIPSTPVTVGADTRVLFNTAGGDPSFGFSVTGGVRF